MIASRSELRLRHERTLEWLLESCRVNGGRGSSAWQSRVLHPVSTWSLPYPETSGYLIPTFYDAMRFSPERARELSAANDALADWLLGLQLEDGAFPGGHYLAPGQFYLGTTDYLRRRARPATPSVFNSGQIIHGLIRRHAETKDERTLTAIHRCGRFLAGAVRDDGSWGSDAYAGTASPAYFTYVSWPLLEAWRCTGDDTFRASAVRSLDRVLDSADPETGFIPGMGFPGRTDAHAHTVGYTIEGLLESAILLGAEGARSRDVALAALARILRIAELRKKMPGGFSAGWAPDWSYACVTGDCQLGLCFLTAAELLDDPRYLNAACRLFSGAAAAQSPAGALPGSRPIWGKYMSFRWPNWAGKFFLDLVHRLAAALERERAR